MDALKTKLFSKSSGQYFLSKPLTLLLTFLVNFFISEFTVMWASLKRIMRSCIHFLRIVERRQVQRGPMFLHSGIFFTYIQDGPINTEAVHTLDSCCITRINEDVGESNVGFCFFFISQRRKV